MTTSVTMHRENEILEALLDEKSLSAYVVDLMTQVDPGSAEIINIPSFSAATVRNVGTTANGDTLTGKDVQLSVDIKRYCNLQFDDRKATQDLGGQYVKALAGEAAADLAADIDSNITDYLAYTVASGTADSINPAGDTMNVTDLRNALAGIQAKRGYRPGDIRIVLSPWACEGLKSGSTGWSTEHMAGGKELGLGTIGLFDGNPVATSQYLPGSVANQKTLSVTDIAGDVSSLTATVAAGSGVVLGMKFNTRGFNDGSVYNDLTCDLVTSTTIGFTVSGSDFTPSAATLESTACANLVFAKSKVYHAAPWPFKVKMVDVSNNVATNVQVSALYGRVAIADGWVKRVFSPSGSI